MTYEEFVFRINLLGWRETKLGHILTFSRLYEGTIEGMPVRLYLYKETGSVSLWYGNIEGKDLTLEECYKVILELLNDA